MGKLNPKKEVLKMALAIWSVDFSNEEVICLGNRREAKSMKSVRELISELHSDYSSLISTPDENYMVFYWTFFDWEANEEKIEALLAYFETLRHSFIMVMEDGNIWTDIEINDHRGCDEEFKEILGWNTEILVRGDDVCGSHKKEASAVFHVEGYMEVSVPDSIDMEVLDMANEMVSEADFGPLRDIEWQISSITHADGSRKEYR